MSLKQIIIDKIQGFKTIQIKSKRFDDIRDELEEYGYENKTELVWNIIHDFPEHTCAECGNPTQFKNFQEGYKNFCNVKCSNKFKGRDVNINLKISKTLKETHRNQSDEYWVRRAEIHKETITNASQEYKDIKKENKSNIMKIIHNSRSKEEKEALNKKISEAVKNSEKAKKQRKRRAELGAKALNDYRKSLTEEQRILFNEKLRPNRIKEDDKELWDEYYKLVWFYTNKNKHSVKDIELRGVEFGYSLDHRYSIKQGFLDKVDPKIIGSWFNLEILTISENSKKGAKCSVSLEELLNAYNS